MDSTIDNCFVLRLLAQQSRMEGHEQSQLPQETMLEVLLWLDRYDLDGKQITSRRLRSLVENNQMPLRRVLGVNYYQPCTVYPVLSIDVQVDEEDEPHEMDLDLETDADVQKAVSFLSSCFVPNYSIYGHHARTLYACPDRRAIITAPALTRELTLQRCDFEGAAEDGLSLTLQGIAFQRLSLLFSPIPGWQVTDVLLESLRLRGCNEFYENSYNTNTDEKSEVTEEGILSYLFTLDDKSPMPDWRFVRIECVNITPAFFKKLVQASKNSQHTCDVQLWLYRLRFDVSNMDVGVPPTPSLASRSRPEYRYNIADHGNGIRLVIHFTSYESYDGAKWDVIVRHGKKHREQPYLNYFKPEPEEEQDEGLSP
ncbi:hypothetical protein AAVH_21690 [Aphelenchoides avenae]|nr:hypothetical protein AAVH_21690 [Aphelenchus avenae]